MLVAALVLSASPPGTSETLSDACGPTPSWACEATWEATGWRLAARAVDWIVARPLAAIVIVVIAALLVRWLHKLVTVVVTRAATGEAVARLDRIAGGGLIVDARQDARARTVASVARAVVTALVWTVATLMVLGVFHINLGPLLASAGIAAVAVGLGAQSLVKDCIGGFFILLEDQFGVGDEIEVGAVVGTVESITLRMTQVRAGTGTLWSIPNGTMVQVGNRSRTWSKGFLDVLVANDRDIDSVIATVEAAARAAGESAELAPSLIEPPEVLGVERSDAVGTVVRVAVKTQPGDHHRVMRALRLAIKRALDAADARPPAPPAAAPPEAAPPDSSADAG